VVALVACASKPNPSYCYANEDCDPATPFCDVNGEFAESGYATGACISRPAGCSIERCGCTPDEPLTCENDRLTTCASDGRSSIATECVMGCATDSLRCLSFEPSNDLGAALVNARAEPDVIIPAGATIDTSGGSITSASGTSVPVHTEIVTQGASAIRVFVAKSFIVHDVKVRGQHAFALVAADSISIRGVLDASADGATPGPGASSQNACRGRDAPWIDCGNGTTCSNGAGGAGNATIGGGGGYAGAVLSGGDAQIGFAPLVGGCRGGNHLQGTVVLNNAGAGGGAVQLVAGTEISLMENGVINVSGGGGEPTSGGGSGGLVVLESPLIQILGTEAGVAANGGAGGACGYTGPDGSATTAIALGSTNCVYYGGNGGTGTTAAADARRCTAACIIQGIARGAGGGAAGRARFATRSGTVDSVSAPIMSVIVTSEILPTR